MPDLLLECTKVSKSYGGVKAVMEASIQVGSAEIVGLVGPNGAGKTTLVDVVTGQQSADSGTVHISGNKASGSLSRRARKLDFARTFQHPQLAADMTVRENLLIGCLGSHLGGFWSIARHAFSGIANPTPRWAEQRVTEIAAELALGSLNRPVSDLSLGEQRLVEVARALLRSPQMLLLDEPFAGGDLDTVEAMSRALKSFVGRGCGILLVDHNVDIVAGLVDKLILMDQGQVVFTGAAEQAMASEEMQNVYFGKVDGSHV